MSRGHTLECTFGPRPEPCFCATPCARSTRLLRNFPGAKNGCQLDNKVHLECRRNATWTRAFRGLEVHMDIFCADRLPGQTEALTNFFQVTRHINKNLSPWPCGLLNPGAGRCKQRHSYQIFLGGCCFAAINYENPDRPYKPPQK